MRCRDLEARTTAAFERWKHFPDCDPPNSQHQRHELRRLKWERLPGWPAEPTSFAMVLRQNRLDRGKQEKLEAAI